MHFNELILRIFITDDILIEDISDDDDDDQHLTSDRASNIIRLVVTFFLTFRTIYSISDQAILLILKFMRYFIAKIGSIFQIRELSNTDTPFPKTMHGCYSLLKQKKSFCVEFIACPSCHMLYDQSILAISTRRHLPKCTFVEFPDHPYLRFRQPCNSTLLNSTLVKGKLKLKPKKLYYFYGIKASLCAMLLRKNFLNICNEYIRAQRSRSYMADIVDGKVWNELLCTYSTGDNSNVLGILLNVDWFQPFKHIAYSVGVMYAVIINLPRAMRYKKENVMIIGVIPGPKEPKKQINSYLGPFVRELLELQNGIWFQTSSGFQFVKCLMVGLSSDIPATRKAGGFVGHKATKACSRCLKDFHRINDHVDCSGFDRDSWITRSYATHCTQAQKAQAASTKTARKQIEKESGARYSILFELPYYDAIRFANIDSMHNVFLGTAKHVMALWKDRNILTKEHFMMIQEKIENISVPMDIGRIPYKIESAMAGLTADQWKNWTCIYSLYALHDILPHEHLHVWWLFVQASCIVCQPVLSQNDISVMDNFFQEFCQEFERLFGPEACTINLHLHCHLADCLRDYGPSQSTWCFGFERLNGILGNTPTNMKNLQIEKTLVNRFIQQVEMCSTNTDLLSELKDLFPYTEIGSVHDSTVNSESYIKQLELSKTLHLPDLLDYAEHKFHIEPVGKISQQVLDPYEVNYLKDMYENIFSSQQNLQFDVTCLYHQFIRVKVADKMLSSKRARSDHSSFVAAK